MDVSTPLFIKGEERRIIMNNGTNTDILKKDLGRGLVPEPKVIVYTESLPLKIAYSGVQSSLAISREIMGDSSVCPDKYGFELVFVPMEELVQSYRMPYRIEAEDSDEGYLLVLGDGKAVIGYKSERGKYYGIQTLAQLIALDEDGIIPGMMIADWPSMKTRCFHVSYHITGENLPICSPNFTMLLNRIEECAHLKMNAMLIEFEAMFPYKKYPQLSSGFAFTREQLFRVKELCKKNHVTIIPVLQCLGHVYYILRYPEFAHLREIRDTTQQFCPSNPAVKELYIELADEILEIFDDIQYFHMGGDEAMKLAQCPECKKIHSVKGMSGVYGDHVNSIGKYFVKKGIKPLIWADMLGKYPGMINYIDNSIGLVFWNYDLIDKKKPYCMEMFVDEKRQLFGAAAARFGETSDYMFLYKKSMRGIGVMASECIRNGVSHMMVTDWPKPAPPELSVVAIAYGAEIMWDTLKCQQTFCRKLSRLLFGVEINEMDAIYQLLSELSLHPADISPGGGTLPYSESMSIYDMYDRYDMSAPLVVQSLLKNTRQDVLHEVEDKLKRGLNNAEKALALIEKYKNNVIYQKRVFSLIELSAKTQKYKCEAGLAITRAVRLLKYPAENEKKIRKSVAAQLRALKAEGMELRVLSGELLREGFFDGLLPTLLDIKFDPESFRFMEEYAKLLESDQRLQGIFDFRTF